MTAPTNCLYYGDNLEVLRAHVASESVDLVYLDPPFGGDFAMPGPRWWPQMGVPST